MSWIDVDIKGNKVEIDVDKNNGSSSRSGTVTIVGCENKTISVSQQGKRVILAVSTSQSSLSFGGKASSATITVDASSSFSSYDNKGWIETRRFGDLVTITVERNTPDLIEVVQLPSMVVRTKRSLLIRTTICQPNPLI